MAAKSRMHSVDSGFSNSSFTSHVCSSQQFSLNPWICSQYSQQEMLSCIDRVALFNPETSILIQKRHPYTGNLNSEMLGDSKNVFQHWGDVLAVDQVKLA